MTLQKFVHRDLFVLTFMLLPVCSVLAQSPKVKEDAYREPLLSPSFAHFDSAFSRMFKGAESWIILGTGIVAGLSVHPFDNDISAELQMLELDGLVVDIPNQLGGFWVMVGGNLVTHIASRLTNHTTLANTSLYVMEAMLVSELITLTGKYSVRRVRPDGSNSRSFPSGHATATMTLASVIQKRHGWKAGLPAYLLATWVGLTRVISQKHFASDVLAGATIGIIVGRSFVPQKNPTRNFGIAPGFGRGYLGVHAVVKF